MTGLASTLLVLAQAAADIIPVPPPPASSNLEIGGLITLGTGFLTVFAAQVFKPWLEAHYADRKHRREIEAMDMANDLKAANERNALLARQVVLMQERVAQLEAEVTSIRAHWKDDQPPPPASSSGVFVVPPPPKSGPGGAAS